MLDRIISVAADVLGWVLFLVVQFGFWIWVCTS